MSWPASPVFPGFTEQNGSNQLEMTYGASYLFAIFGKVTAGKEIIEVHCYG